MVYSLLSLGFLPPGATCEMCFALLNFIWISTEMWDLNLQSILNLKSFEDFAHYWQIPVVILFEVLNFITFGQQVLWGYFPPKILRP